MATLKTCFKCGQEKPRTEFHARPESPDGLRNECKQCRCSHQKMYAKTESGRRVQVIADQNRNKKFPQRRRARSALFKSVFLGKVNRHPCWVCGADAEAHHPDYSSPYDVVWLCSKHHKETHLMARNAA